MNQLLDRLSEHEACGFEDLFDDVQTRPGLIVTFLALLEMIHSETSSPIEVMHLAREAKERFPDSEMLSDILSEFDPEEGG